MVNCFTYMTLFTLDRIVPLIFGIVETWFTSTVPDVSLNMQSYSILR